MGPGEATPTSQAALVTALLHCAFSPCFAPPTCNREKVRTYASPFGPSAENDQMRRLSDPRRFTHMPGTTAHNAA